MLGSELMQWSGLTFHLCFLGTRSVESVPSLRVIHIMSDGILVDGHDLNDTIYGLHSWE